MTQDFITTFQHKSNTIGLARSGHFIPFFNDKPGSPTSSLASAEAYIDKEISKTKTKRVRYGVNCLVLGSANRFGGNKYCKAIYRGINISSGDPMVTIDGTKTTVRRYHLYRLPEDWAEFEKKLTENREAHVITKAFTSYIDGFKVNVPGLRYSDGADEVSEKEKLLAEQLQA
jgi:hypothetical protein